LPKPSTASAATAFAFRGSATPRKRRAQPQQRRREADPQGDQSQRRDFPDRDADEEIRPAPQQRKQAEKGPFARCHRPLCSNGHRPSPVFAFEHALSSEYSPRLPDSCGLIRFAPYSRKSRHRLEIVEVHAVAHVLPRGVAERLKVPGANLALAERGADKTSPALTFTHAGVEFS
jgi:hypothetical protein